jgi:hypothetical protein
MAITTVPFRFSAATGLHRGDRAYQQDQVEVIPHPRTQGSIMAIVADGMGGKSGGRKAADQVLLTARQIYERFAPLEDDASEMLKQVVTESHLMIKLTAITSEEEPHSTLAAFSVQPSQPAKADGATGGALAEASDAFKASRQVRAFRASVRLAWLSALLTVAIFSGVSWATASMSMPPASEATKATRPVPRSTRTER